MMTAWRLAACGLMVVVCLAHAPGTSARSKKRARRARAVAPFSLTAADGTGLRLVALRANVVVDGPLAFTELRLTFYNPENRSREGRFTIALRPTAAISRLAMKIDGRWQEGEIVERQKARVVYESYLHVNRDPALLEKGAGNTFRARVFPIDPLSKKELRISYSEELGPSRRPYRLRLRGLPRIGRVRIRALVHRRAPRGLRWRTRRFSRNRYRPRRDFTVAQPAGINGLRHGDLAVVRLAPKVPARWQPMGSLLVLLDTSASQALDFDQDVARFGQIVETLARRHGRRMRIRVACFDQLVKSVYTGPAGGFRARHLRRIRNRGALGASNLEAALLWAARQQGYQRLLLITDGVATAGKTGARLRQVLRGARAHLRRVDVLFTGYNRDDQLDRLVTGVLATDGIVMDNNPTPARISERLGQIVRTRVRVSVEGATWVWPRHLDSLQPGSEALIYVKLPKPSGPTAGSLNVQLTGHVKQRLSVPLLATQRPLLERAWVRSRIAFLGSLDWSAQVKKRIIRLSQRHRVLSEHTALLVLENDAEYRAHGLRRSALSDILTVGRRGLALRKRTRRWYRRHVGSMHTNLRRQARSKNKQNKRARWPKRWTEGQDDFWDLALPRYGKVVAPSVEQVLRNAARRRLSSLQRPTVFMTRASVSGGLDASTIRRSIRRRLVGIRHCYQTELQMHPWLEGVVKIAFTIRRDARVGMVRIASSTLNNRAVEACILRQVRTWRFSAVDAARMPYVVYPLRFTNRALLKRSPRRRVALSRRLALHRAKIAVGPSTRVVLTWETDANDMDLKVGRGTRTHRGKLYRNVTTGFGPECVVLPRASRKAAWPLRVAYSSRGPMGYGLGTVSVLRHDGHGGLRFDERPFVIMKDGGTVSLGTL